jgi:hypothetical protein
MRTRRASGGFQLFDKTGTEVAEVVQLQWLRNRGRLQLWAFNQWFSSDPFSGRMFLANVDAKQIGFELSPRIVRIGCFCGISCHNIKVPSMIQLFKESSIPELNLSSP